MCGIVGCINSSVPARTVLDGMTATLHHRGPDGRGTYFSPDERVGLGHTRLSIIDLVTGDQPMSNEDGTVWVVFNGEIYNFVELREELSRKGHTFRTRSDTEVIVHAYEEFGDECVARFEGMFAFGLYDERSRRALLARDRVGQKPLYYARAGDELLFASEVKALLVHPSVSRELDYRAVSAYLAHEYVPHPLSIFRDVAKLPPGHLMAVDLDGGRVSTSRYWRLRYAPKIDLDEEDAAAELERLLERAVSRRLVSDVPIGVFLSGGVDSSTVVALAARALGAPPRTFNVAFGERSYDESRHARRVAEFFGTDHHQETFTIESMRDVLEDVVPVLDEPFADASLLPTYLLARFTRESVTVALGGDGCDEFHAGYPTFYASAFATAFQRWPAWVRGGVRRFADRLPMSTRNFSFDFKLRQFLRGADFDEPDRTLAWLGSFRPPELDTLLTAPARDGARGFDPYARARTIDDEARGGSLDWLDRLVHLYADTYLTDDILFKVDRASMANSLEVRSPFLDADVLDFVGRLPTRFKLRGRDGKYLLKKTSAPMLPPGLARRRKKGFGIPTARWINGDLAALVDRELSAERLRRQGLFDTAAVHALLREHRARVRNHRKPLWTILMFQLWAEHHLRG